MYNPLLEHGRGCAGGGNSGGVVRRSLFKNTEIREGQVQNLPPKVCEFLVDSLQSHFEKL